MAQELTALLSERQVKAEALEKQAMAERSVLDRLSLADVVVQRRSRVLQQHVQPGDFVKQGEPLVSMIDCAQPVVLAEIEESKFRALKLGMSAIFLPGNVLTRFDSEAEHFPGQVVQLLTPLTEDVNNGRSAKYRVVVRLEASLLAERCEARLMGNLRFISG